MKAFNNYLKSKGYSPRTVKDDLQNVTCFLLWYKHDDLQQQAELTVPELVEYINSLQQREISPQVINQRLRSIRKYYDYLALEGYEISSFEKLKVKGQGKKKLLIR